MKKTTTCYTGGQPIVANTQLKPQSSPPIAADSLQFPPPVIVHTKNPSLVPIFQVSHRSEYISSLLDPTRNNTPASTLDCLLWLTAASRDGDPRAQFTLAHLIYHGHHIQQNPARAFEYRLRAANGGHVEAMVYTGRSFFNGDGVAKNEREGVRWMHLAAMKGHPIAMLELGMCFHYGRGVVVNLSRALMWYIYSAEAGCYRAMSQVGVFYSQGVGGVKYNPREAVTWFERASKGGDSFGLYNLSVARRNGWGIAKDLRIAFGICTRGASTGDSYRDACYLLGRYFQDGEGVNADLEQAKAWYWKAVVKGHEDARKKLELLISPGEVISEPAPLPTFEDWELGLEVMSAESPVASSSSYETSQSSLGSRSPDLISLTLS